MAHDAFVSYSSRDTEVALAVVKALEAAGVRCWIAPRDIKAGDVWAQAIVDAIGACRVQVLVFSSHANRSSHVVNEVDAAIRKGAVVIPFRVENVMPDGAMEYHLRTRHWLDAFTQDRAKPIAELVAAVTALLGRPAGAAPQTEFGAIPQPKPEPVSKSRRIVESTESGFHLKVPRPTVGFGRTLKRSAVVVGVAAILLLGAKLYSGMRSSTLTAFEFRERSAGSDFRTTLTPTVIRFFEEGPQAPPLNARRYSTTFVAAQARYIYTEVDLVLEPPQRLLYVPLACTIFGIGEAVIANFTLGNRIAPGARNWFNESGWGAVNPGNWKSGRYRVDCRYGEQLVARGKFEVLN